MTLGYKSSTQEKNLAWFLPRPKPDRYKGGMPLHCEDWLLQLASDILGIDGIEGMAILNLFCGMNKHGTRVDIKSDVNPDFLIDAHEVSSHFEEESFDVVLADPPYSTKEAKDLYGTPAPKYKTWTAECERLIRPGGLLIVYHKYVMPNPDPDRFHIEKRVFVGNRTYHVPRCAIYFRKRSV